MRVKDEERRRLLLDREFWTPAEGALMIRRDKRTVNRWITAGLPTYPLGGLRYVRASELREWAADPTRRTRQRKA